MSGVSVPPIKVKRPGWGVAVAWIAVWIVAGFGLAWLARGVDWAQVRSALATADFAWVLVACAVSQLALPLWIMAWRALIPDPPSPGRLLEVQTVMLAGIQTLSILGGGVVAVFMLVRRAGLGYGGAVSILALDQVLTGLTKVVLVGAAVSFSPAPASMRSAGLAFVAAVTALCCAVLALSYSRGFVSRLSTVGGGPRARLLTGAGDVARGLAAARTPGRFGFALVCYIARRSIEGVAGLCVMRACGVPVSWEAALLAVAAVSLSTVVPGPPGNLGVYEAAATFAYAQTGVTPEKALALAILQHVAFLSAAVLPGYVTLIVRRPWRSAAA